MIHWAVTPQPPAPLTLEEHRELSREIQAIDSRLRTLSQMFLEIYGPQNRAAHAFQKAFEAAAKLTEELRAQATRDLPGYTLDGLYR
jgi:hypothetical protein